MTSENLQRALLIAGLVVTGFLLVRAWTEDYGGAAVERQLETARAEPTLAPVEGDTPDVAPEVDEVPGAAAEDVPRADGIEDGVPEGPAPAERLVEVESDTLRLWIDRVGGDVVKAALLRYPVDIDQPDVPLSLLGQNEAFVYVAQSGLTGPDGPDRGGSRPRYDEVRRFERPGEVVLELSHTTDSDLEVVKRFRLPAGEHVVDVVYSVANRGEAPRSVAFFAQLKSDGNAPDGDPGFALGPRPYWGAAYTTPESKFEKVRFSAVETSAFQTTLEGGWVALMQHYFLGAWVADPDRRHRFYGRQGSDGLYRFGYTGPAITVEPGAEAELEAHLYLGPKDQNRLVEVSPNLKYTVDYGFLWWIAEPLFQVLAGFHSVVGNWGLAIILLTLVVKLLLYPLSAAGYRSMANMRRVAPEMKRLQERYSDDRQKLSQEMMALYQREKINPLGGCFPILIQMPVFLALYWVLYESVELRHAPFVFWIRDLAAMDPFLVLPLLMGASMYLQQLLSPPPPDPTQARILRIMPVAFTFLFLFFPAGLVLYWLVNNVLSVAQQWYVTRTVEAAAGGGKG